MKKPEKLLYCTVQSLFPYLEAWITSVTDRRTDRQTDILIANAA